MLFTRQRKQLVPNRREIQNFIVQLTASGSDDIDFGADLITDDLLDSIGMMELLTWLEKDKGIIIPEDQMLPDNFRTIDVLHDFLKAQDIGSE